MSQPKVAAFFDVDGTLLKSNIVLPYIHFRTKRLSFWIKPFWLALFALRVPLYLVLDKISRSLFNKLFYRSYRGMDIEAVKNWANEDFKDIFLSKLFVDAVKIIREYKSRGLKVVLVTGSLDFIVQPLARFLQTDALIAAKLEEKTGKFTGKLVDHPIVDGHKAAAIRDFASRFEIDLSASYAYGDSMSDLEMLKCVGQPIAVNPDSKLLKTAKKAGWKIFYWKNL